MNNEEKRDKFVTLRLTDSQEEVIEDIRVSMSTEPFDVKTRTDAIMHLLSLGIKTFKKRSKKGIKNG